MAERKTYVICDDGCKFEGMTKEEILAAIAEATGKTLLDVDGAFITMIKEQNAGDAVKVWVGTQEEYNALPDKDAHTLYFYEDTDYTDLAEKTAGLIDGTIAAKTSEKATNAVVAQYASSDKSKGTIEERLTNLGFREGSATFNSDFSIYSTTHNFWKRQGNYVFGKVEVNLDGYYDVETLFTLPEYARPKEAVNFVACVNVMSYSGLTYNGMYSVPAIATIYTNGTCKISFEDYYESGMSGVNSSTFTEIGSTFKVDFGFEATPIT